MRTAVAVAVAGAVVAVLLATLGSALLPEAPQRSLLPGAPELAALEPYLEPVTEQGIGPAGGRAGLPTRVVVAGDPFRGGWRAAPQPPLWDGVEPGRPADPARPRWTLSAIMVTGNRRIAIINDQVARPGDTLNDGARLVEVGDGYVTIMTAAGERRRLELER
jgi:hypothetical protein